MAKATAKATEAAPKRSKASLIAGINAAVQQLVAAEAPDRKDTPPVFIAEGNEHLLSFGLLPFGNAAVDGAIGGGVPRGGIIQIYGPEGVGKTRLCFDMIAHNQKEDSEFYAMVIHLESRAFPLEAMIAAGVDLARVVVVSAMSSADKTFNIAFKYLWDALKRAPIELDGRPLIDALVIDSIAAVEPEAEVLSIIGGKVGTEIKKAKGMEGSEVALQARLLSKFFRFICGAGALGKTTLFLINQERTDVGGYSPRGTPKKATGGMAVAYYVKISLKLTKSLIYEGKPGSTPVIGQEIIFDVQKNNTGRGDPHKRDSYKVIYGKGVDAIGPLIALATSLGIIVETSAGRYVIPAFNPDTGEVEPVVMQDKKVISGEAIAKEGDLPGKEVLDKRVRDNKWLLQHLENAVAEIMTKAAVNRAPEQGGDLEATDESELPPVPEEV
jgi:recombination protein RecA